MGEFQSDRGGSRYMRSGSSVQQDRMVRRKKRAVSWPAKLAFSIFTAQSGSADERPRPHGQTGL
nr:MAG TPA: hypothetical protein [Caudoviricetes sp.]